ncbi:TetR/AcrR family transcriptional regulator [Actinoplanes sp. CA-015351]|uniref:TetR/AcrR family transcriptional regulator n=1 Tax=Actinoplanes sp. CA-015351 TaxID=3239897 RepID=UPI003D979275
MPRGVAVPEPRQHLFAALERVIAAEGPLTSRAVTQEAGVATGLLFTHFGSFDNFLAGYGVDRSFQIASALSGLPGRFGSGTVAGNLTDAVLGLPLPAVRTLTRLTAFHPSLIAEIEGVLGAGSAGVRVVERAAADYLAAEQQLGRIPAGVDTLSLALAVAAVVAFTGEPGLIGRVFAALIPAASVSSG